MPVSTFESYTRYALSMQQYQKALLAILQEEVFELQTEVYKNHARTPEAKFKQRKEAIQVAVMAMTVGNERAEPYKLVKL